MKRFWDKVDQSGECWVWTATKRRGYGRFYLDGKPRQAHRVSYELANGPIPEGLVIDHLCRNKTCVRPAHLRATTQQINVLSAPTIIAEQVARNVCNAGHPYSGIDKRGYRICHQCDARRHRERYARKVIAREHTEGQEGTR